MRTTTPACTCVVMSAWAESIDVADELDAAVDRSGVHEQLARRQPARVDLVARAYSRSEGGTSRAMRSFCIRSA